MPLLITSEFVPRLKGNCEINNCRKVQKCCNQLKRINLNFVYDSNPGYHLLSPYFVCLNWAYIEQGTLRNQL